MREGAAALFGAASRPQAILLTHCHPDHSGAAPQLTREWDRPAYLHPEELPIALGDFDAMIATAHPLDRWVSLPIMRAIGRRRREAVLARGSLGTFAHTLRPGQPVPGLPGWECIATPGHTPGHLSFFRSADGVLISGDALLTVRLDSVRGLVLPRAGLAGPPWYTTWSRAAAARSIQSLAALQPQVLAAGHGEPMTSGRTTAAIAAFAASAYSRPTGRAKDG